MLTMAQYEGYVDSLALIEAEGMTMKPPRIAEGTTFGDVLIIGREPEDVEMLDCNEDCDHTVYMFCRPDGKFSMPIMANTLEEFLFKPTGLEGVYWTESREVTAADWPVIEISDDDLASM